MFSDIHFKSTQLSGLNMVDFAIPSLAEMQLLGQALVEFAMQPAQEVR